MKQFLFVTALSLLLAGASAAEQGQGKKHQCSKDRKAQILKHFDTDKDGKLSESERAAAKAGMQERRAVRIEKLKAEKPELFARIDKNGDGSLNRGEIQAARAHRKNHKCDKGNDGAKRARGNKGERTRQRGSKIKD